MFYTIVGLIAGLGLIILSVFFSGCDVRIILDPPSLLIVLGMDACVILVSGGIKDFFLGMRALFSSNMNAAASELLAAAEIFGLLFKSSIGAGMIGFILAVIMMMVHSSDPRAIAPILALGLFTVLYGLALSFLVFLPGRVKLLNMARQVK